MPSTSTNIPVRNGNDTGTLVERLIYVHVGKTGGQTLDWVLRSNCDWIVNPVRRQNCSEELTNHGHYESQLSLHTMLTIHCFPRKRLTEKFMEPITGFLVTIRNPITRVISSFHAGHPTNTRRRRNKSNIPPLDQQFYLECFPTMKDLATTLQHANNTLLLSPSEQECYQLGVKALEGTLSNQTAGHLAMNYGYYDRLVVSKFPEQPPQRRRTMWIVRTEHLWQDLARIDQLLGGSGVLAHTGEAKTHNSETFTVRQGLAKNSIPIICCFMGLELQLYENWLRQAINLQSLDKETTMAEIYNQCNVSEAETRQYHLATGSFSWMDWVKTNEKCLQLHVPQVRAEIF